MRPNPNLIRTDRVLSVLVLSSTDVIPVPYLSRTSEGDEQGILADRAAARSTIAVGSVR